MGFDERMHLSVGSGIAQNRQNGKEQDMPKLIAIVEAAYEVDVAPNDVNRRVLTDALDKLDVTGPPRIRLSLW